MPVAVFAVSAVTGLLCVASAVSSNGSDLRPAGGDLGSLIGQRTERVEAQRREARLLQGQIELLSEAGSSGATKKTLAKLQELGEHTGMAAVHGPGLRVRLDDAPREVEIPGLDPNALVVHQQDLQAFVNALWAGGAEAVSLQGRRLISTTGIKCVGNTVVLDGVPYSPPYVIEAIGDQSALDRALSTSSDVRTYDKYVRAYDLGLKIEKPDRLTAKPYAGAVGLKYATPAG